MTPAQCPELALGVRLGNLSLRANFVWTFSGTVVYAACNWGMLGAIAKLGGATMLGQYALAVAVATPVFMLSNVNLRAVLATDVKGHNRFREFLDLRYLTTVLSLIGIFLILSLQHFKSETAVMVMLVGILQGVEAISDVHWGLWQRSERMQEISISMIGRGLLSLATMATTLWITRNLMYALCGVIAARLFILTAFDIGQSGKMLPDISTYTARRRSIGAALRIRGQLLWLAFPLGVVLMFSSLAQNIPTYFVRHDRGLAEVGVYAALVSLLSVGTATINALGQSAMPRLANLYSTNQLQRFRRLVMHLLITSVGIGLAGVLVAHFFGELVLRIMYRAEFSQHTTVLVAIMSAGIFVYAGMLVGYASTAARAFRPQVPLFAIVAGASLVASFVMVPSHGLMGAAMSLGAVGCVHLAGETLILSRALRIRERELHP